MILIQRLDFFLNTALADYLSRSQVLIDGSFAANF